MQVYQDFLDNRLTVLFYCAHINKLLYFSFGLMSALDILTTVLKSSAAHTRLLARLVVCCLHPIMEDHHTNLLELTIEETELLLSYIRQPTQSCGLDPAKLLKAASVLFQMGNQSTSAPLLTEITQSVISLLLQDCNDNCITEGALYLLWTLCHVPEVKYCTSKKDNLTQVLMSLQRSPCSIVSSPARSVLWQLGHGSYEGSTLSFHYTACSKIN